MSDTLQSLYDKDQIREQLARYCRVFDRMDHEGALAIWHLDGTAQYLAHPLRPLKEFLEGSVAARRSKLRMSHQITNTLIKVDGDKAVSEAYGTAWLQDHPVDGIVLEHHFRGRYLDRWSRRDGRWAIDHRRYICDCYTPREIDASLIPEASITATRPDRGDPSYEFLGAFGG